MPAPSSQSDPLFEQIKQQVRALIALKNEPGVYVKLVQLGLKEFGPARAAEFSALLKEGGLSRPRASEIKIILQSASVARRFVATEDNLSVRDALAEARKSRNQSQSTKPVPDPSNPTDDPAPEQSQAQGIWRAFGKLLQTQSVKEAWTLDCGLFQLSFQPIQCSSDIGPEIVTPPQSCCTVAIPTPY